MALSDFISSFASVQTSLFVFASVLLGLILYRTSFHPLRKVPGPFIAKCTSLWLYYHSWAGDEASRIQKLHQIYGSVVRIAPNEVDIDDGEALLPIYTAKGGFLKAECYLNFDIDGHHTIFSAVDPEHRRTRLKAVVNMFSTSAIYSKPQRIRKVADDLVKRMREEAAAKQPVNILNLTRCLAVDSVTSYLFGRTYGAMQEEGGKMSASLFVDAFVAIGRFFYMPRRVFMCLDMIIARFMPNPDANASMEKVDSFVRNLVDDAHEKDDTYQARLLNAGFSKDEARIQCEDLMFAGTDSTGGTLAAICWHLASNPAMYEKLREELASPDIDLEEVKGNKTPDVHAEQHLQARPYLRAVIQEGLRLAFPNPGRLPRVVPPGGWSFKGFHLPAGTIVGLGTWQLHLKESVFPDAQVFRPDRWLDSTPEMQRDCVPFGSGSRQCIARNLASAELFIAIDSLVRSDVLRGAKAVEDKIEVIQWFNSKVVNERVDLVWS